MSLPVTRGVVMGVAVLAVGALLWALPGAVRFAGGAPDQFWAMVAGALIVDVPLFGVTRSEDLRVRSTLSVCFVFAIFVVWGPAPAIVVQTLAATVTVIGQHYPTRSGVSLVSRLVVATAAAALAVAAIDPRPVTTPGTGLNGNELTAFTGLVVVWLAVNAVLLIAARATVKPLRQAVAETRFDLATTAASILVVAPLLTTIRGWWALFVALPLLVWNLLTRSRMRHEQRLAREPDSGLLNRQGLAGGLTNLRSVVQGESFGVVLVNIESVLRINRMLGRDVFEHVVAQASRRLTDVYGEDRVARLSGEEVGILIPGLTAAGAVAAATKAVETIGCIIEVDEIPFALDPAAGVALSPLHGRELTTLLAKAELAVSEARRVNQPAVLYVRQAAEVVGRRIELLRELRGVLSDPARWDELTALYQPQVDLATGRLHGVEALTRWNHPRWGPVPIDELIEAIEPTEVMHQLTSHVLSIVAQQQRRWNDAGEGLRVAVNVSMRDLHEPSFPEELLTVIGTYGLPPAQLTIEMTERMLISDAPRVEQAGRALAEIGVGLSLDDFGTGYASLQQLRQLPLTEVKIDQSYVRGIVANPTDAAIVTGVHALARALDVEVVAEGIEDQRTCVALSQLPGVIGQGWLFGKPMTAADLHSWRARLTRAAPRGW